METDSGAPGLGVGFEIDYGNSFATVTSLDDLIGTTAANAVREFQKVEQASRGAVDLGGATSTVKTFGAAATRELETARQAFNRNEKAGEAMVRQLERQAETFGKTRDEIRSMKAESLALAAQQAGNADLANRIRAAEQAVYDQQFAAMRRARQEQDALAQDRAQAAASAEAAAARESQALRSAAVAHQMFEARVRQGAAAMREADAAAAADAATLARLREMLDPAAASQDRLNAEIAEARRVMAAAGLDAEEMARAEALLIQRGTGLNATNGQVRAGMQQLSYNLNDAATMWNMNASASQIFTSQLGQTIQAVQLMSGESKGLLGVLGSPWVLIVTSAMMVLVPFVAKLWESGDAAEDAAKKLTNWASSAGLADKSREIMQMRQNLGELNNQLQWMGGRDLAQNTFRGRKIIGDIDQLSASLRTNEQLFATWQGRVDAADGRAGLLDRIAAGTDKVAAATQRHQKAMQALDLQRDTGKIGDEEYVRQGIVLQKQLDAVQAADRNAASAKREHNKELREQVKLQRELQSTYDAIIGRFDPMTAAADDFGRAMTDIGKLLDAGMLGKGELGKQMADQLIAAARQAEMKAKDQWIELDLPDLTLNINTDALTAPIDAVTLGIRTLRDELIDLPPHAQRALAGFADAWGQGGRAVEQVVYATSDYLAVQRELKAVREKGLASARDEEARSIANAKFARDSAMNQIGLFGDLTSAAKGFFNEGSSGYKALATAERAFRAIQFALSIRAMVQDAAETVASIANSGARTAVKAVEAVVSSIAGLPFPFNLAAGAATIAALGSIGVAVAGAFGGGSSAPVTNEGKGTVFGDNDAKSDSIKRALDFLADLDTESLVFTRQMAASLKAIETNIGGLTNLVIRLGGTDGVGANAAAGVDLGFEKDLLGKTISAMFDPLGIVSKVPIVGDILGGIGKILGGLFGTKTTVQAAGIFGGPQTLGAIDSVGFDGQSFADIKRTKKFVGISTGSKYRTEFGELDGALEDQFGKLLLSFADAIKLAAGPLGLATGEVEATLNSFVVSIGKVDLKGLSGEEIQERLTAVFGQQADLMAQAVIDLQRFQQVGEGAFETLIRVAATVDTVTNSLLQLGLSTQSLGIDASMAIADLFGGAQEYATAADAYFGAFYSDAEQAAAKAAQLGRVFDSLGVTMPESIASYRALVEAQDLTTAAGQQLYAQLLQLAPAFAEIISAGQQATTAATILRERNDLERQILNLEGKTAEIRALELASLDPSNRALQERINALQDEAQAAQEAARVADERAGLERQLLQLTGNTAALRALDLAKLDASNRALQVQIYALQDQQKAAQEAAAAAKQLSDAWKSAGESIQGEIDRIRGGDTATSSNLATMLAQFNAANAAARGGDIDAARSLPGLSKALLDAAADQAKTSEELKFYEGMAAGMLEKSYQAAQKMVSQQDSAAKVAERALQVSVDQQAWWQSFSAQQTIAAANVDAANDEMAAKLDALDARLAGIAEDQRTGHATLAANTGKTARILDNVTQNSGGDAFAVEIEDTVSTKEAA